MQELVAASNKTIGDFVMTSTEVVMVASACDPNKMYTAAEVASWIEYTREGKSTFRGRRVVLKDK